MRGFGKILQLTKTSLNHIFIVNNSTFSWFCNLCIFLWAFFIIFLIVSHTLHVRLWFLRLLLRRRRHSRFNITTWFLLIHFFVNWRLIFHRFFYLWFFFLENLFICYCIAWNVNVVLVSRNMTFKKFLFFLKKLQYFKV